MLEAIATSIREQAAWYCESTKVPGYLAGVYHDGEEIVVAHGKANLVTGSPMCEDTGFLFGSIAKMFTSTLFAQQIERGAVDLDDRVVSHLPQFTLTGPTSAEKIRIENLLNHTNGIDGDLFFIDTQGPDALSVFVRELGSHCGSLFEAGEYMSYSNAGMIVAGRVLEVVTGVPYHKLLKRELFTPIGMNDSGTSAEEAILRSTAVGHFLDPTNNDVRRTNMFKLPDSWSAAGGTPVGSVRDLLAFGRTHLLNGVSPSGNRVLSRESTTGMQAISHDMKTPNVAPVGLGWSLVPFGEVTVLSHSGASPGGVALFCVLPERDLVFAAFGNDPRAMTFHDKLFLWLLREHFDVEVSTFVQDIDAVSDLTPYAGTYRSNQMRVDISVVEGQLEERVTYEPLDDAQAQIFAGFSGGSFPFQTRRLEPIGQNLFAPAGIPLQALVGYSRAMLVSFHDVDENRANFRCAGGRMTRRSVS